MTYDELQALIERVEELQGRIEKLKARTVESRRVASEFLRLMKKHRAALELGTSEGIRQAREVREEIKALIRSRRP